MPRKALILSSTSHVTRRQFSHSDIIQVTSFCAPMCGDRAGPSPTYRPDIAYDKAFESRSKLKQSDILIVYQCNEKLHWNDHSTKQWGTFECILPSLRAEHWHLNELLCWLRPVMTKFQTALFFCPPSWSRFVELCLCDGSAARLNPFTSTTGMILHEYDTKTSAISRATIAARYCPRHRQEEDCVWWWT